MVTAYATVEDLADWMDPTVLPSNATQLLRSASFAVREATSTAFYAADPVTGLPTDASVLQAFKDATCAQAAALASYGVDPLAGGILEGGAIETSAGIGTARVSYADAPAAVEAQTQLLTDIAPEAARILRQSQIIVGVPWVVG